MMRVEFEDRELIELLECRKPSKGIPPEVLKSFQKKVKIIQRAKSQLDIRQFKSLHLEKIEEDKHSIRLNRSWRMILRFLVDSEGDLVVIIEINNHYND
jgi:plasmid maintenance system killer protein